MASTPYYTKAESDAKVQEKFRALLETSSRLSFETEAEAQTFYAALTPEEQDNLQNKEFVVETGENAGVNKFDGAETGGTKFVRTFPLSRNEFELQKADIFRTENEDLFPDANLPVRRYTSDTGITDYDAGYSQTAAETGLLTEIPSAGSGLISHFLNTGNEILKPTSIYFNIQEIIASNSGIGIGYISGSDYIMYYLSSSGTFRKRTNYSEIDIAAGMATYQGGDSVRYDLSEDSISIYVNDILAYLHTYNEGEFTGNLLIGQRGFLNYVFYTSNISDPIRTYVRENTPNNYANSFYKRSGNIVTAFTKINGDKYVGFDIEHEVDMSEIVYKDYWRITRAKIYIFNGSDMGDTGLFALTTGESECVWKRSSLKDDFTGGYHGDELVTDMKFYASGVEVDLSIDTGLTPCDSFYYLEKSTMHETAEGGVAIAGHPIECYHTKKTEIKEKGYETFNRLTWVQSGNTSLWYHGIACIGKDTASNVQTDEDFTPQQMTGSSAEYFASIGYREMYGWNDVTKYSSKVSSELLKPNGDTNCELFIADRTNDSKYYRKQNSLIVAEGDVWESVMTVKFDKL